MAAELKNEFSWSNSRDATFRECPRRYYFRYYGSWGGWSVSAASPGPRPSPGHDHGTTYVQSAGQPNLTWSQGPATTTRNPMESLKPVGSA